jgi:hypothetical protein
MTNAIAIPFIVVPWKDALDFGILETEKRDASVAVPYCRVFQW